MEICRYYHSIWLKKKIDQMTASQLVTSCPTQMADLEEKAWVEIFIWKWDPASRAQRPEAWITEDRKQAHKDMMSLATDPGERVSDLLGCWGIVRGMLQIPSAHTVWVSGFQRTGPLAIKPVLGELSGGSVLNLNVQLLQISCRIKQNEIITWT